MSLLLYGYTHLLVCGRRPSRWRLHLAPGLGQRAYLTATFLLPLDLKMRWSDSVHGPWISPAIDTAVLVGLIAYPVASMHLLSGYRTALAQQRSHDDRFAARWLRPFLAAMIRKLTDQIRQSVEASGDAVTDLPLRRLGPGHLGVILSVVTAGPRDEAYYRARLVRFPALSHITIETCRPDKRAA